MLGIFGMVAPESVDEQLVYRMASVFGNLGKVDTILSGNVAMGAKRNGYASHNRNTIVVLEELGLQTIFCGEIINRNYLISVLHKCGVNLSQEIDNSSLFSHVFAQIGSRAMKEVNGLFTAAIYNFRNRSLHLFLDRTGGVHGIYYFLTSKGFIFSSSIHSLLSLSWCTSSIDIQSLFDFFSTGYILPPHTLFDGIRKMGPGEQIEFCDGKLVSNIVDRIRFETHDSQNLTADDLYDVLAACIGDISSDSPDAAYLLSGGIDTSTIVAIASQVTNQSLTTFTGSFPGTDLDESGYARIAADHYHCYNHCVDLSGDRLLEELPDIVWYMDEPSLDYSVIPTYHLFKEMRKHKRITVSGDGPDHLFGRYYPLAAKRTLSALSWFISPLSRFAHIAPSLTSLSFLEKIQRTFNGNLRDAYKEIFLIPSWGLENADKISHIFSPELRHNQRESQYFLDINLSAEGSFEDLFNNLSYIDYYVDGSFGVFSKIGKMARANELIVHEPYLDRRVVDCICSLPIDRKVSGSKIAFLSSRAKEKYILKYELGPKLLPKAVLKKPKGGFTPPLKQWLKGKICRTPIEKILCPFILEGGYFKLPFINEMFRQHVEGRRDWSTIVFMLISFDLWVRMNVENHYLAPPGWKLSEIYAG